MFIKLVFLYLIVFDSYIYKQISQNTYPETPVPPAINNTGPLGVLGAK